jgi:hypothetical protein
VENNKDEKFQSCTFRSENTFTRNVKVCCNRYKEVEAFHCDKREIFPLTSDHCEGCGEYINKVLSS